MGPKFLKYVTAHNLRSYRDQLAKLTEDQVVWEPYTGRRTPMYCTSGEAIWMSRVPLICFERVEWHLPDRVLRQFGMLQGIPRDCDTEPDLHRVDKRGNAGVRWSDRHRKYIDMWTRRQSTVVQGIRGYRPMHYTDDYMIWYRAITCMFVQNPRHVEEVGYRSMAHVYEGMVSVYIIY